MNHLFRPVGAGHHLGISVVDQLQALAGDEIGAAHEADVTTALSEGERDELARLLGKVAADHGLAPNVRPGYSAQPG